MDMAVGVIVGGAFTSIVTSLNADILTPILGIFGGTDFFLPYGYAWNRRKNAPVFALWQFYYCSNQFSDHGTCDFYYVESYQPDHRKKLSTLAGMEEEKPEPTTKNVHSVMRKLISGATRCPHCTSVLDEQE